MGTDTDVTEGSGPACLGVYADRAIIRTSPPSTRALLATLAAERCHHNKRAPKMPTPQSSWSTPTSNSEVHRRAAGRRKYNALRTFKADIDESRSRGCSRRTGPLGAQARIVRELNVHPSTICPEFVGLAGSRRGEVSDLRTDDDLQGVGAARGGPSTPAQRPRGVMTSRGVQRRAHSHRARPRGHRGGSWPSTTTDSP